ncbi:DUF4844 domain-containing protein [Robertkochia solimangrovi]|uniref:DUF4844 domain-containing protein n=1 Tax=Robertkochia solimangrovi TaxID=2213046 RepID=UPI00117C1CA3|nr:DUF4844 domain-containing protein [Robertkochia solimangrovi]TRZ43980.1 DUF4844 domain-containing protein [Robertkochia solimangrovi]
MKPPENASQMFDDFIAKEKFIRESSQPFYPGIRDEKMRPTYSTKINQVAESFRSVAESAEPTEQKYLEEIRKGLLRFEELYLELDTEDRERVCSYFEELMDIVELASSNGQLNNFMYGFDPNGFNKTDDSDQ